MISLNGYQAILFDLDGTLRHNRPSANDVFFDQAITLGANDSSDDRREAMRWTHHYFASSPELDIDVQTYGDDQAMFWHNFTFRRLRAYGCSDEQAQSLAPAITQYMAEIYEPEDWIPPDVPETLRTLRSFGFTLGVVSNRDAPFDDYLIETGLQPLVDFSLSAGEANSWKPDTGIFQQALQKADARPEQAIYVGDNYYADIVGAQRAGITPVLIDPEAIFPDVDCQVIQTVSEMIQLVS